MRTAQTVASLRADLASSSLDVRSHAMLDLVQLVKRDAATHGEALPLFEQFIREAKDPSPTGVALRGYEYLRGPEAARPLRMALLQDPRPNMVVFVLMDTTSAGMVPTYVGLLERHTDQRLRETVIRKLGKAQDPAAFEPLVALLPHAELRPHVVEALADLRDARAIPHLQPLLFDRTEAWPMDNHGPMLSVADLAAEALRRLPVH